ncbi:TauD/TfdA family dioxygenase [Kibdelosporangium lantanae]|uniref:TauD/TfdA family dioxygenase n=1 Tax=Kibdelosporangium lantanae TaxID=1497396 RepID=A0ABW3M133_9PSEU
MIEATGSPVEWAVAHRAEVRSAVTAEGWVLVRGLDLTTPEQVGAVAAELGSLMEEREGHAKRHTYAPGVYSSSVWTDDMPMCMHHELSYARTFPRLMMFGCLSLADSGGEVELADARAVLRALRSPMFDDFISNGWQLTRNYHPEAGTPWEDAFGTTDKNVVEAYCRSNGIHFEWRAGELLRTSQTHPAVFTHPVTGEECWFNQIAFLNEWTMLEDIRDYLVGEFGRDGLPFNTTHADGRLINAPVIDELNAIYEKHATQVHWQPGDLLVVDNIATSHSRKPFSGNRKVVVAMADPLVR